VSALTATIVVSVALVAFGRRDRPAPAPTVTPTAFAPPRPAPTPVAPVAAPTAVPTVSDAPNPAELPLGFGYLTVVSPANANVFISGKLVGPVNKSARVRCGRWFIRLAAPSDGRYPEWVTAGETVVVPCQQALRLEMGPHGQ
jgi:hypothetical protein